MRLQDAFNELGLGGDETPEAVRRAYMRLLKQRKPEVDPEGFRRLREAYEGVLAAVSRRAADRDEEAGPSEPSPLPRVAVPAAPVPAPNPVPPEAPVRVAPLPREDVVNALPAKALDSPLPFEPSARSADQYVTEAEDLPLPRRIPFLREAVSRFPDDGRLRARWVNALLEGSSEETVPELRRALADGFSQALSTLVMNFPLAVVADDVECGGPQMAWEVLSTLLRQEDFRGEALAAAARLAAQAPKESWPEASELARMALALFERGVIAETCGLVRTAHAWLDTLGSVTSVSDKAAWLCAYELAVLPEEFPAEVRRAIASGLSGGKLVAVHYALSGFRSRSPVSAGRARMLLRKFAPTLDGLVGPSVDGSHALGGSPPTGWQYESVLTFDLIGKTIEGVTTQECPRCTVEGPMWVRSLSRRWRFRTARRVADFLMCEACGQTARTGSRIHRLWLASWRFIGAAVTGLLGLAALATIAASAVLDADGAWMGQWVTGVMGLGLLLAAWASFRAGRALLASRSLIPMKIDPRYWKPV